MNTLCYCTYFVGIEQKPELFARIEDRDLSQLSAKEWMTVFEKHCDSDYAALLDFAKSIPNYNDAVTVLSKDTGAAWKLIFKLLARGRLYDIEKQQQLKITGRSVVNEFKNVLFADTFA